MRVYLHMLASSGINPLKSPPAWQQFIGEISCAPLFYSAGSVHQFHASARGMGVHACPPTRARYGYEIAWKAKKCESEEWKGDGWGGSPDHAAARVVIARAWLSIAKREKCMRCSREMMSGQERERWKRSNLRWWNLTKEGGVAGRPASGLCYVREGPARSLPFRPFLSGNYYYADRLGCATSSSLPMICNVAVCCPSHRWESSQHLR